MGFAPSFKAQSTEINGSALALSTVVVAESNSLCISSSKLLILNMVKIAIFRIVKLASLTPSKVYVILAEESAVTVS